MTAPPPDLEAPATGSASREELLHLLAEAAELEHNLLCSYLFAAFSLKIDEDDGLSPAELAAVRRWRGELMGVCVEEMTHLAQVANLSAALGARPHFDRPNLPLPAGYHPAGLAVELRRFDLDTLEHFTFLERGDATPAVDDSSAVEPPVGYVRGAQPGATLMPTAPDYATIGEFYERLSNALASACSRAGEHALFLGGASHQMRAEELGTPALRVVTSLAEARRAIDCIVEQGEGGRTDGHDSHFARFSVMQQEYLALLEANPAFAPARPVGANPVQRAPMEENRTPVTSTTALPLLDAANASYALMLRCLTVLYDTPQSNARTRGWLVQLAMAAMKLLGAAATRLSREPAQDGQSCTHAGMSFTVLRATEGFRSGDCGLRLLRERAREVAEGVGRLKHGGAALEQALEGLRKSLAEAPTV